MTIRIVSLKARLLDARRVSITGVLILLFLCAAVIRLYRIDAPGVAVDREYRSAIIARAYFFENTEPVEDWRREAAQAARKNRPALEPPITEYLVSLAYTLIGKEDLWLARVVTSVFWLIGGICLFELVRRMLCGRVALIATAYYLFVPLGILVSRSFQPDSLMMMTLTLALLVTYRYSERPSLKWLLVAITIASVAALNRPLVFFPIVASFVALMLDRRGLNETLKSGHTWAFLLLSPVPSFAYYGFQILFGDFPAWKLRTNLMPELFFQADFWGRWTLTAVNAVGFSALIGALLGAAVIRKGPARALLIGLTAGYLLFCGSFNYYVRFANYYHVQLIPAVAILLGLFLASFVDRLIKRGPFGFATIPLTAGVVLAFGMAFLEVRSELYSQELESRIAAREIGEIVRHSTRVVTVSRSYGTPVQYLGEFTGTYWPRSRSDRERALGSMEDDGLSVHERLVLLPFWPEYFVITDFSQFEKHHEDLKTYLAANCTEISRRSEYLVYAGCPETEPEGSDEESE